MAVIDKVKGPAVVSPPMSGQAKGLARANSPLEKASSHLVSTAGREMAKVYRETRCNKILPSNGTKLVYMLINILKAYEVTEIEKRLSNLELANLQSNK